MQKVRKEGEEGAKHRAPLALRRMTRAAICCHSAYGEKIRRHVSATQTKAFPTVRTKAFSARCIATSSPSPSRADAGAVTGWDWPTMLEEATRKESCDHAAD
ncbi:unnamed protein product [Durusdinium trenchii]|uniref:Uncharacterized protein n=1 Tax=Durusdinium trenchii TaxID=1381693 RepID=A0ABP0T0M7_9DINO